MFFSRDLPPGIHNNRLVQSVHLLHIHPSHCLRIIPLHRHGGQERGGCRGVQRGWQEARGEQCDDAGLAAGHVSTCRSFSLTTYHVLLFWFHAGKYKTICWNKKNRFLNLYIKVIVCLSVCRKGWFYSEASPIGPCKVHNYFGVRYNFTFKRTISVQWSEILTDRHILLLLYYDKLHYYCKEHKISVAHI